MKATWYIKAIKHSTTNSNIVTVDFVWPSFNRFFRNDWMIEARMWSRADYGAFTVDEVIASLSEEDRARILAMQITVGAK